MVDQNCRCAVGYLSREQTQGKFWQLASYFMEFREPFLDFLTLDGSLLPARGTHIASRHSTTTKLVQCDML